MEKGIKVVAVNDPFIDLEYMVSSRQKAGWETVGPEWQRGSGDLCGRLPAALWTSHGGWGALVPRDAHSPSTPGLEVLLSPAGVHV